MAGLSRRRVVLVSLLAVAFYLGTLLGWATSGASSDAATGQSGDFAGAPPSTRALRGGGGAPPGLEDTMQALLRATEPPTKQQLGHATWTFLHRMAAQFPAEPTAEEQASMASFFTLFGQWYPCHECAEHFRGMLSEFPPDTRSNLHLSMWLCRLHNIVNARVGHDAFECVAVRARLRSQAWLQRRRSHYVLFCARAGRAAGAMGGLRLLRGQRGVLKRGRGGCAGEVMHTEMGRVMQPRRVERPRARPSESLPGPKVCRAGAKPLLSPVLR